MSTQNKEIANTIWAQMKTIDTNLCMCMGVQKLAIIENGLQFNVNGLSFKGIVKIQLNGADLYDVTFVKVKRTLDKELQAVGIKRYNETLVTEQEHKDVYVEDLMTLLETVVENREKVA